MVRKSVIGPTAHWSKKVSLIRKPIGQKTHWSKNPMIRRPITIGPKKCNWSEKVCHWSDGSLVRRSPVGSKTHWSEDPLPSSSPSCRQTQFSSSRFCRGHPPLLLRWLSCQISHSPGRCHLQCSHIYSCSRLFTCPNHLSLLAFMHLSVIFSIFIRSLMFLFLTWSLSVWPHAHLHIVSEDPLPLIRRGGGQGGVWRVTGGRGGGGG